MYGTIEEKKVKILEILKEKGETPTTKIMFLTTIEYYRLQIILEELMKEGKISKKQKGRSTYWSIIDGR